MNENENKPINNEPVSNAAFTSFAGVKFLNAPRAYFFGIHDLELKIGDLVVVETVRGLEIGEISIDPIPIEKYNCELGLKPVLRIATDVDKKIYEMNQKDAKYAFGICQSEIQRLNLDMNLISCEYTLDKQKVLFSYLADERVDFRDLLKALAGKLHTRIELRQIGSRDKAKMIGGIGICGLPLCCSTFLNEFDGISINRAKNQMLAINIPKLSGQCGKLICCLKYEDETYLKEREKYPELGSKIFVDKEEFTITGINIISGVLKLENSENVKFISYDDIKNPNKKKSEPKQEDFEIPVFKNNENSEIKNEVDALEENSQKDQQNQQKRHFNNHRRHNFNNRKNNDYKKQNNNDKK